MTLLRNRVMGCLIGGAIGDCIGAPLEGRPGPLDVGLPPTWEITDDTQLTLATCEAIVRVGGVDPEAIAKTFGDWFSLGRITGVGSSTLKALRDLSFGAHWALAGASGEMSAGNGAAMRIAPLAFCVDPFSDHGRGVIKDVSRVTHRSSEAFAGALAVAAAISFPGFAFLPAVEACLSDSNTADRLGAMAAEKDATIAELGTRYGAGAYVAESVPLALVAAARAESVGFLEAVLSVVRCGGDTDTTASMVGQIVGSKLGTEGIPSELKSLISPVEPIMSIAAEFADFVKGSGCSET